MSFLENLDLSGSGKPLRGNLDLSDMVHRIWIFLHYWSFGNPNLSPGL